MSGSNGGVPNVEWCMAYTVILRRFTAARSILEGVVLLDAIVPSFRAHCLAEHGQLVGATFRGPSLP